MNRQLNVKGYKIHYLHAGKQHNVKETRVFLHGWALRGRAFEKLVKALGEDYQVIAPDLPGFGKSDIPYFWGFEAYAQFICDFLDELGLEKVHLMGQSMGGGIALATAALHPERIQSVMAMNSAGVPMTKGRPSLLKRFKEIWAQGYNHHLTTALLSNLFKRPRKLLRLAKVPMKHDLRPLLPRIKAPVLLAWGDLDHMYPVEFAQEMAKLIPNARVEIIHGGHHEWGLIWPEIYRKLEKEFAESL